MRDIVARRHLVTWQQGIWDLEQIKLGNLNGCFDPTWHCVCLTDIPQKMVKVQFRGPELFKKNGALFQEELYLPGIFMPPWTSWRYDCGWMASSQFGCNFNVFAESFCHTAAIASTWQPVSTALPARGCHALQRVIGWDPGWELLCTCCLHCDVMITTLATKTWWSCRSLGVDLPCLRKKFRHQNTMLMTWKVCKFKDEDLKIISR